MGTAIEEMTIGCSGYHVFLVCRYLKSALFHERIMNHSWMFQIPWK